MTSHQEWCHTIIENIMTLYFQSRIPVYVAQHPAGTSVQNFIHAAQVGWF